ncbi:hypothetical protein QFZ63_006896 [Streptomyces sp. B3I7]|uniref:carboxypeptidase regulatory-like domain-containing protein n=1 Tax=Streptomyces sp. B3I7 TaxID=3042269 RepID=UPI00278666FF|nr:carboxypeptidase regulatory-like domain-containing protein [Streptomyces sp. B3I7]MDQ0815182.1 hypothetical protein [Streptomyces sp. B3I7]
MRHREVRADGTSLLRTLAETLMFPTILFLGLLFCFTSAFHAPRPHDARVVVAHPGTERVIGGALRKAHPGGFDVTAVANAGEARRAVLRRDAVAGYAAESGHPVLYVAQANGTSLEQALAQDFTELAARDHHKLTITDVAPTVSKDRNGTTLVYLGVAWSVPGYILATTLLRVVTFDRRRKVITIAGVAAFFGAVGYLVGRWLDYLPDDPSAMAIGFLLTMAVGTFSAGVAPFTRKFFPLVGMGLFIVLSVPTSGVAPVPLLPTFFQDLHAVMPLGNAVDALRGLLYFDGAEVLRPVLVLCVWIAAGVTLLALDAWRHRREHLTENAEEEQQDVPEPPAEDPSVEIPAPTALPVRPHHHFGEPLPMLEGTVRDDERQPVRHAVVTVMDGRGRQLVRTTTNTQGEYAVTGLPEGHLMLVVSHPGRHPVVHQKLMQPGAAVRADFTLHGHTPWASFQALSQH